MGYDRKGGHNNDPNVFAFSTELGKLQKEVFGIKVLNKIGIDETYLNIIKATYQRPTATIIFNRENQSFSSVVITI